MRYAFDCGEFFPASVVAAAASIAVVVSVVLMLASGLSKRRPNPDMESVTQTRVTNRDMAAFEALCDLLTEGHRGH